MAGFVSATLRASHRLTLPKSIVSENHVSIAVGEVEDFIQFPDFLAGRIIVLRWILADILFLHLK